MMRQRRINLSELDRATYRAITAFLDGRLKEQTTIDWALRLKPNDTIKRLALLDVIDSPAGKKIGEPWQSAWRMIEEYWNNPAVEDPSIGVYDAQHRLRRGDTSGSLVAGIVELVTPRLKVEPFSNLNLHFRQSPRLPKKVEDLFRTELTSWEIVDPSDLEIQSWTDRSFLVSLAHALDAAVASGLDIARRIGWDGENRLWQIGGLHRVYYVPVTERDDGEHEPDEFHNGIAPSVKLLHAVVSRLVNIDFSDAVEFVQKWNLTDSLVHLRLWAALSRDGRVTPANKVGDFLLSLDDRRFWSLNDYPELAELRAMRFAELDPDEQTKLTARIRKCPPRNQWPRKADTARVGSARLYCAVQELRRIELAGASLPARDKTWLESKIVDFPDLVQMSRLDHGFLDAPKAGWIPPNPDSQYDLLTGEVRLKALEAALSSARRGWEDDPASRASDWVSQPGNPIHVIVDFESVSDGGATFTRVWEKFGWAHSSSAAQGKDATYRDLPAESARVLSLLVKLPEETIRQAIDGISHWLSSWERQVVTLAEGPTVWLKVWPIAVEATNAKQSDAEEFSLNTVSQSSDEQEPMDLDTLNTPAGRLVGVFLAACPTVRTGDAPFLENNAHRQMRDAVGASIGPASLIVKYRLIEGLHYFLKADFEWTRANLVPPLLEDNSDARALWRAVARRTRFFDELKVIGGPMVERSTDPKLGRKTRRSLVFSLVIESLHALREQREPAVPYARIQQMIRALDDEVRAYGAEAVQRFVRDVSAQRKGEQAPPSAEQLFRSAAAHFLQQVWPQERSLSTPGVSQALADLPTTAGEAFSEAVDAIERFLVPFECWSMHYFGLYGELDGKPNLSIIDNYEKAAALLRLLDLTIGTTDGSVIPHDLAEALDQIRKAAPNLVEAQVFRRLATAARRG
jgi:hypothetical protein